MHGLVTFVLPRLEGGGGLDRIVAGLAAELHGAGLDVDVVRVTTDYRDPAAMPPGVRATDLGRGRVSRALPAFAQHLRRTRPIAVLGAAPMGNLLASAGVRLARVDAAVILATQNDFTTLLGLTHQPKHRATLALIRRWYPAADALVAVSHGLAGRVAELTGVPPDEIEVVRNPVLGPAFEAALNDTVDHPWFGDDGPPVVINVARLSALKDLPTLIAAFDELRRRRPARLALLGDGPLRGELERDIAARGLGDLVWMPGFVEAPQRYLARADVFALSSVSEGLGNVLVEALAAGLPVVSTDCPYGPREILRDGKLGRLVPVGDPSALADGIERALDAGPPALPPDALRDFDRTHVGERYLEVIERAVARRRATYPRSSRRRRR